MLNPVDPTTTPAWKRLTDLHDTMTPDLRAWFADDPERAERFSYELGDLYVDLSKNLLTDDVRDALAELAEQVDVPGRRDAMYAGDHINITEDRGFFHLPDLLCLPLFRYFHHRIRCAAVKKDDAFVEQ